ncbi:hypothetical protein CBL_13131 [Carabus blaptoides fortunei]
MRPATLHYDDEKYCTVTPFLTLNFDRQMAGMQYVCFSASIQSSFKTDPNQLDTTLDQVIIVRPSTDTIPASDASDAQSVDSCGTFCNSAIAQLQNVVCTRVYS